MLTSQPNLTAHLKVAVTDLVKRRRRRRERGKEKKGRKKSWRKKGRRKRKKTERLPWTSTEVDL